MFGCKQQKKKKSSRKNCINHASMLDHFCISATIKIVANASTLWLNLRNWKNFHNFSMHSRLYVVLHSQAIWSNSRTLLCFFFLRKRARPANERLETGSIVAWSRNEFPCFSLSLARQYIDSPTIHLVKNFFFFLFYFFRFFFCTSPARRSEAAESVSCFAIYINISRRREGERRERDTTWKNWNWM